jgi:hypothetical protein
MRKPVILDVNPDAEGLAWEAEFLGRLEAHVLTCQGPEARGGCPLLDGRSCAKVEAADGILFQLDLDKEPHRAILAHYASTVDAPIRVIVRPGQSEQYADLLATVEVRETYPGPAALDGFEAEVESEIE